MLKRSISRNKGLGKKKKLSNKRRRKIALGDTSVKDEQELMLETVVFGGSEDIAENLGSLQKKKIQKPANNVQSIVGTSTTDEKVEPKPVWEDDEEASVEIQKGDFRHIYFKHREKEQVSGAAYSSTLKSQFEKVIGKPSWARMRWEKSDEEKVDSDDDEDGKEMLQSTGNYLSKLTSLPGKTIQLKRLTDGNNELPTKGMVKAMEFHPNAQVMLTGGTDSMLGLFQINGKQNPKIQSICLEKFPILHAHFSQDGTEVVLLSRHKGFKYYDMLGGRVIAVPKVKGILDDKITSFYPSPDGKYLLFTGQYGQMYLLTAKTKELIEPLKMNGSVDAIAFSPDGSKMFSFGDDAEVYVWDMKTRDCIHRFVDDGCTRGTTLAVSNNGQYIATGSHSGVVNVYDERCLTERIPKHLKAVTNLTTPCTSLMFNSTTEILAMASNESSNAVKLLHMASFSIFANFPNTKDVLRLVNKLDFSLNSGYLAMGNNKGEAMLYRLKHYGGY